MKFQYKYFAAFLKAEREKRLLTQMDIARELKYTTAQFVSHWERGLSHPPEDSFDLLSKMLLVERAELVHEWVKDMIYSRFGPKGLKEWMRYL